MNRTKALNAAIAQVDRFDRHSTKAERTARSRRLICHALHVYGINETVAAWFATGFDGREDWKAYFRRLANVKPYIRQEG